MGGSDPTNEDGRKRRRLVSSCENYRSNLINNNYDNHYYSQEGQHNTSCSTIARQRRRGGSCHRSTKLRNSSWLNYSLLVFLVLAQLVTVFFGGVNAGIVGNNDFTGREGDALPDSSNQNNQDRHLPVQQLDSSQWLPVAPAVAAIPQNRSVRALRYRNRNDNGSGGGGNQCREEGYFGDENDCRAFVRCVLRGDGGYDMYRFMCGDGTVFNEDISTCDHPWAVSNLRCAQGGSQGGDQSESGSAGSPGQDNQGPSNGNGGGNNGDNHQSGGGGGGSSDNHNGGGNQQQGGGSNGGGSSNQQGGSNAQGCSEEGYFPNESNCRKFYRCYEESGSLRRADFDCPPGTVYDTDLPPGQCNHPSSVSPSNRCYEGEEDNSIGNEQNGPDSSNNNQNGQESPNNGQNGGDSGSQNQGESNNNQNGGESSNNQNQEGSNNNQGGGDGKPCDKDQQQSSSTTSTTTTTTTTTTEQPNDSQGSESNNPNPPPESGNQSGGGSNSNSNQCSEEGYFPNENDCKKFYRCYEQAGLKRADFDCPPGTVYDTDLPPGHCNHPWALDPNNKCYQAPQDNNNEVDGGGSESDNDNGGGGGNQQQPPPSQGGDEKPCNNSTESNNQSTTEGTTTTTTTEKPPPSSSEQSNNEGSGTPPSNSDCKEEGFFPNEDDCTRFYRCVDFDGSFTKFDFKCGPGTQWHAKEETCVHPWQQDPNAKCLGGSGGSDNEQGESSSSTTSAPSNEGDSSSSKPCDNNNSTESNNDPTTEGTTTTTSSTTESPPPSSSESSSNGGGDSNCNEPIECKEEGFYGNPNNCSKFYRCVDYEGSGQSFTLFHFECGEGTWWDDAITTCNYAGAQSPPPKCAKCMEGGNNGGGDGKPCDNNNSTTESNSESESTTEGTTTTTTTTTTTEAPPPEEKPCDKENSTTEGTTTTSSTTESPPQSSSESSGGGDSNCNEPIVCKEEGFYGNPNNCSRFYRCVDYEGSGQSFTLFHFECGEGTWWDDAITTCNYAGAQSPPPKCAKCMEGGNDEGGDGKPCDNNNSTTESNSDSESTTEGTTTTTTTTTTTEAPPPEEKPCDKDNSTTEGTTTTTTESPPPSSSESNNEGGDSDCKEKIECKQEGYYGNPNNCSRFYRCVDFEGSGQSFTIFHFECGEGTWWDDSITTCNYAGAQSPAPKCAKCMNGNNNENNSSKPCDNSSPPPDMEDEETTTEGTTTTTEGTTTTQDSGMDEEKNPTTTSSPPETTTAESMMNTTPYCPTFTETTTGTTMSMSSVTPEEMMSTTQESTTTTTTTTTTTEATTTTTEAATTTTEEPEEPPPPFEITCENPNGKRPMRPHPQDCQRYYVCTWTNGTFLIKVMKCQDGHVFVYEEQECIVAEKAKPCNVSTTEESLLREKCERLSDRQRPPPAALRAEPPLAEWNSRPAIRRDDTCKNEGMFAIRSSCNQFVRCYRTAGGHFAKFRYRCPEDFYYFRGRCMSTASLRQLGIICPYYSGPSHDDPHYLPTPVDTTVNKQNGSNNKVEYPLKKPDYYPEIIDMERQDIDNYDTFIWPAPN